MPSVRSLPEATQKAKTMHLFLPFAHDIAGSWNCWKHGGAKCWLHCVDYLHFWSKLFSVEVKNFKETRGKFLAWNKTQNFSILNEKNSSNYIPANFFWDVSVRFLSWQCRELWTRHDHFLQGKTCYWLVFKLNWKNPFLEEVSTCGWGNFPIS